MKGKMGKDGNLRIGRKGKLARVYCPYVQTPIGYTEKPCGDWCPLFDEPLHGDYGGATIEICHNKILDFTEFTDERVTNDERNPRNHPRVLPLQSLAPPPGRNHRQHLKTDPKKVYLSIPYSGKEWLSFHLATRATAQLMNAGNVVYSPITHSHPIATMEDVPHDDHEYWMRQDLPMLDCCNILAVVKLDDWHNSTGVKKELMRAADIGIPVIYLTVGMFATDDEIDEWRSIDGTTED